MVEFDASDARVRVERLPIRRNEYASQGTENTHCVKVAKFSSSSNVPSSPKTRRITDIKRQYLFRFRKRILNFPRDHPRMYRWERLQTDRRRNIYWERKRSKRFRRRRELPLVIFETEPSRFVTSIGRRFMTDTRDCRILGTIRTVLSAHENDGDSITLARGKPKGCLLWKLRTGSTVIRYSSTWSLLAALDGEQPRDDLQKRNA